MSSLIELFKHVNEHDFLGNDLLNTTELADTIVYFHSADSYQPYYINLATKGMSNIFLDVIRDDKKYIFINSYEEDLRYGYIAKYFPEYDAVGVVIFMLVNEGTEFSWQPSYRIILTKHDCWYFNNDGEAFLGDIYKLKGLDFAVDLCGQFVHPAKRDIRPDDIPFGFNIPKTSGEELRKFTKGACSVANFPTLFACENNLYDLASGIYRGLIQYGIEEICMEDIDAGELRLPENIMSLLSESAKQCFLKDLTLKYNRLFYKMNGFLAGYLQNIDGNYIWRKFAAFVSGPIDENGKMPINIIETGRVNLSRLSKDVLKDMTVIDYPLIYFDREGIDDGIFKYCKKQIEEAEALTHHLICETNNWRVPCCDTVTGMNLACCIAFMPIFEKLYRLFEAKAKTSHGAECGIKRLTEIATNCCDDMYKYIPLFLGDIDYDEKELHKALGISKALLSMFGHNGDTRFEEIKFIKKVLKNHTDYLTSMNKKTAENLVSVIENAYECNYYLFNDIYIQLFSKMVCSFGPQGVASYISFISKEYSHEKQMLDYMNYIDKIDVVKQSISDLKSDIWKVKKSELEKADEAINESYITLSDRRLYAEALMKFEERHNEWRKYEYSDSSFMVTYPKGPTELIEEGTKLRHCAKQYINSVASGNTMVLFIRQKCYPKKPFYTIEIKDGEAVQCHGFGNCNVDACNGLEEFIKSFCDKKGIKLEDSLDNVIGVIP